MDALSLNENGAQIDPWKYYQDCKSAPMVEAKPREAAPQLGAGEAPPS